MTSKRHSDEERSLYTNHVWSIDFAHDRLSIGRNKAELLPDLTGDLAIERMHKIETVFDTNGILKPRRLLSPNTQA